jgi:preprotein translocase subunit SecB
MSDQENKMPASATQENPLSQSQADGQFEQAKNPMVVHAQYVKDFSFENPYSPDSLKPGQDTPEINVNIGMNMDKIDDPAMYEVILHIEARAKRGEQTVFLIELDYAVVASVHPDIPKNQRHPLLMIEGPKLAFPFARQILAEISAQGGFPPVLLNPIDFEGLYIQQYQQQQQQKEKEA